MGRFYGWSSTASRLEPFRRGSQIYFNSLNLLFSRDLPIFGKQLITSFKEIKYFNENKSLHNWASTPHLPPFRKRKRVDFLKFSQKGEVPNFPIKKEGLVKYRESF